MSDVSEVLDFIRGEAAKDAAMLDAREIASARSRKAWQTRREIAAGKRPPMRQARARCVVVDGPFAGKTLLLDRASVHHDEWEVPGAMYRFADAPGGRIAYVAQSDPFLPFIGWRGWSLKREQMGRTAQPILPMLASGMQNAEWPGGAPLGAVCPPYKGADGQEVAHHKGTPPPELECGCGIYATLTHHALTEAGHWFDEVVGLLAGWGRVIEHEHGFRFARAYPVLLIVTAVPYRTSVSGWTRKIVGELRAAYGVPVALAAPERIHEVVDEYVASAKSALPEWVYRALPPDLRAAGLEHDRKSRKEHGTNG